MRGVFYDRSSHRPLRWCSAATTRKKALAWAVDQRNPATIENQHPSLWRLSLVALGRTGSKPLVYDPRTESCYTEEIGVQGSGLVAFRLGLTRRAYSSSWQAGGIVLQLTLMVERRAVPGAQEEIKGLLRELRSHATRHPAFISGRSVVDAFNPTNFMTISVWSSMAGWEDWEKDPERTAITDRIAALLQEEPTIRLWRDDQDWPPAAM